MRAARLARGADALQPGPALLTASGGAGPDAYVTAHHLRDMLAMASVEQLLAWSSQPALLVRVPSGALRGRRWDELDDAQVQRVLGGEFGQNPDMLFTARTEQTRRRGEAAKREQLHLDV